MITTAMIMFIIIGAYVFGYFLALTKIPSGLAAWVLTLEVNRYVILAIILLIYLLLGAFMDSLAMILLTVPIFFPVVMHLGFDPIWFGILMVMIMEVGLITPPVGMNVFVVKGIARDVPVGTIFKGVLPHVVANMIAIVTVASFPILALWVPGLIYT